MTSNLFVFTRAFARAGQRQLVAVAIAEILGPTRRESGCISIDAFGATRDPRLFYINSRWEDEAAFNNHLQLPHTLRFLEAMKSLLDEPMNVTRAGLLLPLLIMREPHSN
jgi:quinol monooxygenase YgiN